MICIFDTNVIIAAFVSRGLCKDVFEMGISDHDCVSSAYILTECQEKLITKFKLSPAHVTEVLSILTANFTIIEPQIPPTLKFKDPDDLPILGTAIAAKATALITGDQELLKLKKIKNTDILSPREIWNIWTAPEEKIRI